MIGKQLRHFTHSGVMLLFTLASFRPSLTYAADTSLTLTAQYRQDVQITLDLSSSSEISSLDPAKISDNVSVQPIQNLFLTLTDTHPVTNQIMPELAISWSVSTDGLVWTFQLRDDVMWMQYDPATREATSIRPVTADDFVYGIKRACDPRLDSYYGGVIANVIDGCDEINHAHSEEMNNTLVFGETTQVIAVDDVTLQVRLQRPAGYFLSMTTMWVLAAVPHEPIEAYGDDWVLPGNIITNGPYFVHENIRGVGRRFVRNTAIPTDLWGDGNIDRITVTVIEDRATSFDLYKRNQLDMAQVPASELSGVLESGSYADQLIQVTDGTVFYFGYTHDKPPFDNVHARRAFSAIIDRQAFIDQIRDGQGVPMIHFTPPSLVMGPPIGEIGVGFNPDYAQMQMELAGYRNCEGFPEIDILTYRGARIWGAYWADAAEEHLGCDRGLLNDVEIDFGPYNPIDPDNPVQDRPHAWTLGWGSRYPDSNNWVGDVLHCESDNAFARPCSDVDHLIQQAAAEMNQERRSELYYQIEEGLFGPDGEYPIAPIFVRAEYILVKPWYTGPFESDGIFGGSHWDAYSIDIAAKLAARDE